jgi:thiamine biosynthesis lipoprotein
LILKQDFRQSQILDPETGFPAKSGLISASVIAPEGYLADSLSTAVFVLGSEKGMKLLQSMGLEGILVKESKKVFITRKLKGKITILNKEYQLVE